MKKSFCFRCRFWMTSVVALVLLFGFTTGFAQTDPATFEGLCVDATYESHVNVCGNSPGSVTLTITAEDDPSTCCSTITQITCYLIDIMDMDTIVTQIFSFSSIAAPVTINDVPEGNYLLRLTAFNMQVACDSKLKPNFVTVTANPIALETSGIVNELCPGSKNGSFQIRANDGTPPYSFSSSGTPLMFDSVNQNTYVLFNMLGAGNYAVTATDDEGCTATSIVVVPLNSQSSFTVDVDIDPVLCFNDNTGKGTVVASGGAGVTFTYNWSNGVFGSMAPNLTAGNYQVTITGSNGCTKVEMVTIPQPPQLTVTLEKIDVSCFGLNDGAVTAFTAGGTAPRTLLWNNNSTASTLNNLAPGMYSVVVTDENDCTATASTTINEPGALDFISNPLQNPIQSGQTAQIEVFSVDNVAYFAWSISEFINLQSNVMGGTVPGNDTFFTMILTLGNDRSPGAATFQITPFFSDNCQGDTQQVEITVVPKPGADDGPFIPEIYTPNGDGQNDEWFIVMPDGVEMGELTIYNRLGGKVYSGDTLTPWDGTGCPDGPYFYVLNYSQNGDDKTVKGAVTILRTTN